MGVLPNPSSPPPCASTAARKLAISQHQFLQLPHPLAGHGPDSPSPRAPPGTAVLEGCNMSSFLPGGLWGSKMSRLPRVQSTQLLYSIMNQMPMPCDCLGWHPRTATQGLCIARPCGGPCTRAPGQGAMGPLPRGPKGGVSTLRAGQAWEQGLQHALFQLPLRHRTFQWDDCVCIISLNNRAHGSEVLFGGRRRL